MSTTYDWSPLFGALSQLQQQGQYQSAIKGLFGQQQFNPVQVTPQVSQGALPQSPGLMPQAPGALPINDPSRAAAMNAQIMSPGGSMRSAMGDQSADSMMSLLKGLPPQMGLPLLAQAAMKGMQPQEYDSAPHDGINPTTGKPDQFIVSKTGQQKWLGTAPRVKVDVTPGGDAYDPYGTAPGTHFAEKPTPNSPFNPDGTPNIAYQNYEAGKAKLAQAPAWARIDMDKQKAAAAIPDDATLHDMATRYVSGDRNAGVGMSRNPAAVTAFQNMISQVGRERGMSQTDISQNLQRFHAGTKAVAAFDSGTQGNTTRSLNVAIQHLDTLGNLSDALGNGDVQLVNKFSNMAAAQLGKPAPTNFNAAKAIVGDEIIKAIVGTGGALADRENAQNQISAASSPAQLAGVIKTYKQLMAGQLHGLRQQYESSTGMSDFNDKLFPETVSQLESTAKAGGTPQSGNSKPQQLSPQDAAKLPSGTTFIGLDGVQRVKH